MNNQPPETCYDCKLKEQQLLKLREFVKECANQEGISSWEELERKAKDLTPAEEV